MSSVGPTVGITRQTCGVWAGEEELAWAILAGYLCRWTFCLRFGINVDIDVVMVWW